jgi:HPt (histidine-containing phosphotransfer) domain-containing protein
MADAKMIPTIHASDESPTRGDVFNFSEALSLVGGNRELLCEVARIFLDQYPKVLEEIRQAMARSDYQLLGETAHTLASSVGQLAGQRAFAAAKRLEQLSSEGDRSQVTEALAELEKELQSLRAAVTDTDYFTFPPADVLHSA